MNDRSPLNEGAVALLSGGLDSTVSMALAAEKYDLRLALFFDYGQAAAAREESACRSIAAWTGAGVEKVEIPWLGRISRSALTAGGDVIPDLPGGIEAAGGESAAAVMVENRNAIFINIAAAWASAARCGVVVTGFNRDEAEHFPDNSTAFLDAVNSALREGCACEVRVESPTVRMGKRRIVEEGIRLGIPWRDLWSCYRGGERMCGRCESCLRLIDAVRGTPAEKQVRFEGSRDRTEKRE